MLKIFGWLWFCLVVFLGQNLTARGRLGFADGNAISGIKIISLDSGKVIHQQSSDVSLAPASLLKLVTSAALLDQFGSHHRIKTPFYHSGRISNGAILGDLLIKGQGDPFIVSEHLWQIAADIKNMGINQIKGDIIIDNSSFKGEYWNSSRVSGRVISKNAYDAPISAFSINFNTLAITAAPGSYKGGKALVGLDPYWIRGIEIKNNLTTGAPNSRVSIRIKREALKDGRALLHISGFIPLGSGLKKFYRSVHDPVLVSGEMVRSFFLKQGIQTRGQVKEGVVDLKKSHPLYTHIGKSMAEMINGLGLYSNNFIADSLLKTLGAVGSEGDFRSGLKNMSDFLEKKVGLKKDSYQLYDGSGLNSKNRLSASQLVEVLKYMYRNGQVFPEYLASLPTAGKTGSLSHRFKDKKSIKLQGIVRAKTGSLTQPISVSGLAGYILNGEKGNYAFAIIQNGMLGKPQPSISGLRLNQEEGLVKIIRLL